MPSNKARRLLESAKNSKAPWPREKLDRLYKSFDFVIENRSSHDRAKHKVYKDILATLPRHNEVDNVYVKTAVRLITKAQARESGEEQ